jgi:hypothetical protein
MAINQSFENDRKLCIPLHPALLVAFMPFFSLSSHGRCNHLKLEQTLIVRRNPCSSQQTWELKNKNTTRNSIHYPIWVILIFIGGRCPQTQRIFTKNYFPADAEPHSLLAIAVISIPAMMHTLPVKALTTQCPLLQTGLCHG